MGNKVKGANHPEDDTMHPALRARRAPYLRSPVALAALLSGAALATPALAQSSAQSTTQASDNVVITGSLIRGTTPIGSPVGGMSRADIEATGLTNTVDLLRQLPQIANLGADEGHLNTAQNANQNVTVGSGINLRGLGPESTLLLLNGRRIAPGGVAAQYTDPASIPAIAIERMEVLTDGASSTYGSDAVGGVVNMKLRRAVSGVEGMLRYGTGDGIESRQISAIAGRIWGSGDVMVAVERNERGALSADARRFYSDDMRPWGGPDLRVFAANPGNVVVGTTRYAIPAGQNGVGLTSARLVAGTANLQSVTKGISALPEQNRSSVVVSLNQELGKSATLTLEGFWTKRDFSRELVAFNGNYTVRNTNPFFVGPPGATAVTVNYSFFNDLGTARSTGFERSQQLAAVLNVDLPAKWNLNTYVTHSVTQERNLSPAINNNAVNTALADTNPATALNLDATTPTRWPSSWPSTTATRNTRWSTWRPSSTAR
jgi:iron complex outermembrane recepter protein